MSLTLIILFALAGALVARALKLPTIVGYIVSGIVAGSLFANFLDQNLVHAVSQVGIVLLLFTLGVEFSFVRLAQVLKTVWPVALIQVIISSLLGFVVFQLLGLPGISSLVLGLALSLSSTAIVVKVLSEKAQLETLPGELTTGWLVVQDLAVIPFLLALPLISQLGGSGALVVGSLFLELALGLLKSFFVLGALYILARFLIPRILSFAARVKSPEIFLLTVVSIVVISAGATSLLGLSLSMGAFLAGLLIAETNVNHEVFAQMRPLRDIFAVIFFTSLGLALPWTYLVQNFAILISLSLIILIFKFTLVVTLARAAGFHRKTAFLTSIYLLPVSEFAFIIAGLALGLEALDQGNYQLLLGVTFISLLMTTPLLSIAPKLYYQLQNVLAKFHAQHLLPFPYKPENSSSIPDGIDMQDHVVLCGYGRVGRYIGRALLFAKIPFVVVDYNHATITNLKSEGTPTVYGDPAEKDVLDYAQVDHARAVVIAIPDRHTQELIISHSLTLNRRVKIFCRTHHESDQKHLKSLGVELVIQPEFEAALTIVEHILPFFGIPAEVIPGKISRLKIEHGVG